MYGPKSKTTNKTNVLECRVCEDVFTQNGERIPRLLYCGHTVCHACLLRLPITDENIQCPFDRQSTPVGSAGVWGLKKNFALLELLERLEVTEKEVSPLVHSSQDDPESEMDGGKGSSQCMVCQSHVCLPCSRLVHYTACTTSVTPCCSTLKDHPHSQVKAEAETLRALISASLQKSHQLIDQMKQTVHRLEEVMSEMEGSGGSLECARVRVEDHFESLREKLQREEVTARTMVETHARERLATLRSSHHDLSLCLTQVVGAVVQCEGSLGQDDTRLVGNGPQIKKALESVEKHHQQFVQLEPTNLSPDIPITFTKDNRVHIGPKIELRVVALGLDGAGKTSILFKLKQNEFMSVTPTIGFNVEAIEYKNLRFNIWDIGGQPKLRPLWKHYFLNTQAVVFVVDSSDTDRLAEASVELSKVVAEKELKDAALLILANKEDVNDSVGVESIAEALGTSKLCSSHSWHLMSCSAQTGSGLYHGLDWLSSQLVASPVV